MLHAFISKAIIKDLAMALNALPSDSVIARICIEGALDLLLDAVVTDTETEPVPREVAAAEEPA